MSESQVAATKPQEPATLSIRTAAKISGIGEHRLREMAHLRIIPAFRIGGRWYVDHKGLLDWIHRQAREGKVVDF